MATLTMEQCRRNIQSIEDQIVNTGQDLTKIENTLREEKVSQQVLEALVSERSSLRAIQSTLEQQKLFYLIKLDELAVPMLNEILSTTTFPVITPSPDIPSSSNKVTDATSYPDMPTVVEWSDFTTKAADFRRGPTTKRYKVSFKLDGTQEAVCEKRVETRVVELLDKLQEIYVKEINANLNHHQVTKSDVSIQIGSTVVGYIEVKTPWKFWLKGRTILEAYNQELLELLDKIAQGYQVSKNKEFGTYWGLRQLHGNMFEKGFKYGIISTFNHWIFVKIEDQVLHISPAISCTQLDSVESPGLLRCILYFLDLFNGPIITTRSTMVAAITIPGNSSGRGKIKTSTNPATTQAVTKPSSSKSTSTPSTNTKTGQQKSSNTTYLTIKSNFLSKLLGTGLTCRVYLYSGGYTHHVDNTTTYYPEIALKFVDVGRDHAFKAMALNELDAYERLVDLQGRVIPRILFFASCFPFFIIGMTVVKGGKPISAQTPNFQGIMRQLDSVLDQIHKRGVNHNDLRADNILIDEDNKLWLIDFSHSVLDPILKENIESIPREICEQIQISSQEKDQQRQELYEAKNIQIFVN